MLLRDQSVKQQSSIKETVRQGELGPPSNTILHWPSTRTYTQSQVSGDFSLIRLRDALGKSLSVEVARRPSQEVISNRSSFIFRIFRQRYSMLTVE